jgi:hypothetical protein
VSGHTEQLIRDHCLAPERAAAPVYGGRYRQMFEDLPALDVDEQALHALGRPGGRIVREGLIGIIESDPKSFLSADPTWTPSLPAREAGRFGLADILVPPVADLSEMAPSQG